MAYDSTNDTLAHIHEVQERLHVVISCLLFRGVVHDHSKFMPEEKTAYDRVTPKLKALTYGSDEYKANITELGDALKHHYEFNCHHPEHYPDGVADMSLLDLIEMFCDWKAASMRHDNGDFEKSLEINRKRFGLSDQLAEIFENTRLELGW